jgi:Flp pilus assembly protein TadG
MQKRTKRFFLGQYGSVAIVAAIAMVVLLGMAALALDTGHLVLVKSDLQKAADAGALAGARALGLDPSKPKGLATTLNWNYAISQAIDTVQKNYADGASLGPTRVQAGYWDIHWTPKTAPENLNGYLNPAAYTANTEYEIPAVKVTIVKTEGGTGGNSSVPTLLASVLGYNTMQANSGSVALLPAPNGQDKGSMFPFAIPKYWVKQHWADDPPTPFSIGSIQQDSLGGQWTTFENNQVGASIITDFVLHGNDIPIFIKDQIYIQSGEQSSVFNTVLQQFLAHPDQVYMLAVVDQNPIPTGTTVAVDSFVPFQITGCTGSGDKPYVTGHFVPGYMSPKAIGVSGDYNGGSAPVRIVN